MYVQCKTERVRITIVTVGKQQLLNIRSVCVCIIALVTRHENRIFSALYCTVMCGLSGCIPHFLPLSHTRHRFRGGGEVGEHKTCDLSSSTTFVWNISHSKNFQRDIEVRMSSCKVPAILVRFFTELRFVLRGFKEYSDTKSHENPSIGSRFVPCGQADMTKLIVAFSNFANPPKTVSQYSYRNNRCLLRDP